MFALFVGASAASAPVACGYGRGDTPPPPIVLLVWDTCRADRVGAMGYRVDTTPALTAFARDAVRFRNAWAPTCWTPPAHASLFTGLYPRRHGLLHARGDEIRPGIPLLAETLHAAGYETACVTANAFLSPVTGLSRGFETVIPAYNERGEKRDAAAVVEGVRTWLGSRRDRAAAGAASRPPFLFVNLMDCHLPLHPRSENVEAVRGERSNPAAIADALLTSGNDALGHALGIRRLVPERIAGLSVAYDAAVRSVDDGTSRILALLEKEGLLRNAVVAVTADHGELLGEGGGLNHLLSLADPVLHVPLVVRWRGRLDGGRDEDAPVRMQDLYATLLEAARIPVPPGTGLDSRSLAESPVVPRVAVSQYAAPLPYLPDARSGFPGAAEVFFEPYFRGLDCARLESGARRWKLLRKWKRTSSSTPAVLESEALYDVAADPGETVDLSGEARPGNEVAEVLVLLQEALRAAR